MLINKVNRHFSLDPALTANDMSYKYYPAALDTTADILTVGGNGLIVLARPTGAHANRVMQRFESLRGSTVQAQSNPQPSHSHSIDDLVTAVANLQEIVGQQQLKLGEQEAKLGEQEAKLVKKREDRKDEQRRLEAKLLDQRKELKKQAVELQDHKNLLAKEREQRSDMSTITQLTLKLIPLHLRVLLDLSRKEVLSVMQFNT
ncbi:hypothetical protein LshimejAT787_1500100 [Lyophyllum shimeji]|uniref:Uncharacterized protein n=1 Tax=Lyophyllum shimeji TaxID=47721 RepID=A0A9P3UV62_LYOSH|nr:hypothetical protein LshimejAT787_1500100 [Lyophyllum shimeji]